MVGRWGKYVGGGQTPGHQDSWQEGGRTWRLLVGRLEELLAGGQEEQAVGCQEEGMTLSRWGLLNGGWGREGFCLLRVAQDLVVWLIEKILACGWEAAGGQEEKRTWDLVVVLVVDQTACH